MWQPVDSSSAHSSKALPKEPSNLEDSQNKLGATSSSTETDHTNPATTEESNSRAAILSSPRRSEGQKQRGTVVQSHKRTDDEQLNSSSADASTSPLLTRVKSPSNVAWSAVLPPSKRDTTDATLEEIPTNTNVVYNVERDTARDNLDHSTNNPNPTSIAPSSDNDPNNHEFIMSTSEEIPTTDTHSTGVFHHNMQWPQRRLFTLEEERSKDLSSVCLDPAGEQDNHNTAIEQSVTAKPIDDHLPSLPSNIEMDRYLSKSEANSSIDSHHSAPVEASASVIIEEAITNQADLHDHTNEQLARTPVLDALPKDQTAEDDVLTENKQHLDPHTPLRQDNHRKVSYVSSPLLHWDASPLHEASGSALTKLPGQHAPPSQNALAHYQMADTDDSVAEATNIRDQMTSTADIELTNNNSTISQLPTVENDMTIEVSEELEHRIDTSINLPINGMINRQDPISVNARNLPQESIAFLSSAIPMNDTYIPAISLPNRPNTANLTSSASAPHTPTRRPLSTPAWQPVSARPAGVSDKKVLFNDEFDDDKRERTNRSTKEEQEQEDKDKDKEGTDHYDDMIVRKHHTVDPFTRVNDDQHSNNTNNDNNNTIKSKAVKAASAHGTPATSPRKQQEGVPMNGDLRLSMLSDSAEVMGKAPDRKQHLAQLSRRANMLKMRQSTSSVPGLSNNAESSTSALASKSVNNYEAKPLFAPMKSSDIRKKLEFASNTMTINPITTETINYVPMLDEFSPRSMAASTHFAGEVVVDTTSNTTAPLWPLEQSGQQQQQQQQQQQALGNDWHGMASITMEMNQHHNNQSEAIHLLHNSTTYENTTSNSIEQDIYERQRQHMTAILAERLPSNQWELLNTIDLSDIPTLQSFNGLDRLCPLLEELVARRCSLTSLSGCPSRVQRLNVMGNQLNEAEITKLHHLSELTILELSDNHLRELINFGELKQLRDLRVDRNKISEFEDLSGTRLEHLSLRGNQLVEIDCSRLPCAYMKNLLLNKNSITKVHAIGLLQQLQVLNLGKCRLISMMIIAVIVYL
ncbi:hypothetical protein BDF22DRAFT_501032 [Syncephalis plumigaleata]|nr:hypothetical protein BDF22DRAFT_501032 [Syncephalis plumigaleata]